MIDFIERVGPWLGFLSLGALTILALLYFQQARQIRRLRDWAGRAPERAAEVAHELAEQGVAPDPAAVPPTRAGRFFGRIGDGIISAYYAIDRHSPVDVRILLGVLAVGAIAAVLVVTQGFGILEDDAAEPAKQDRKADRNGGGNSDEEEAEPEEGAIDPASIEVAVLNATSTGVTGLAAKVADEVEDAGYEVGAVADAVEDYTETIVMFSDGQEEEADQLAADLKDPLGKLGVFEVSDDIEASADGADVALVIGQDDSGF